ncbi:hypothetical protein M8C13_06135 [Crossiella sp. SN42]|uniref:hypothetical protein n=1 Tax=Crossiella sp. SN42 TaxID=2944808 RepID=UPI00207CD956|nr:hypothetical protein [Crossiella sp. SN42]MCO1575338.1 hypothetical protein [Crossiella sp. SN42]
MTFFPVPDEFYRDPQFLGWSAHAYALWMLAGSWSADRTTDGFVPTAALALFPQDVSAAADELVERGIWRRARGGYQYVTWPEECSRARIEAKKEAWRQRQRKHRSSGAAMSRVTHAGVTGESSGESPASSSPVIQKEKKRTTFSSPAAPKPRREDVEALCARLAERVRANGAKATVTRGWRDAARLLLDTDERDHDQALRLIDWATGDSFWSATVLSMGTFRRQYDRLLLQARREQQARQQTARVSDTDANIARLLGAAAGQAPRALPGGAR